jgi:uncharacterized membrane protein
MKLFGENILSGDEMQWISEKIQAVEKETIGEIRVNIQKRRSWKEKNLSLFDLAVKNFFSLGMNKTREKTGVLIFLLISEHAFQIVADEGIDKKVSPDFWGSLAEKLSADFRRDKFYDGLCRTIDEVGVILKKEFPSAPGDTNELPNTVVLS